MPRPYPRRSTRNNALSSSVPTSSEAHV
jgi:hypothetical protein